MKIKNIKYFCLKSIDEDDDLSEGDVSADPVEGNCQIFLNISITDFFSSVLYFLGTSKGEKRKRGADNQQENDDDDDGPPQKI